MNLAGDRRGQSIQIGAVLLFGVLIIAFASYQAFVVPDQNREVEFTHNQDVQGQLQDLRNAIVSVGGSDDSQSVAVQLGTRYPSRLAARNPGPVSGSLETVGTGDTAVTVTIANAQATGENARETGDFWNESQRYDTGVLTYQPNYNLYTNRPTTVYEHSVLYNRFETGNITLANQSIIDGTDISLVVLNGSLSRSTTGTTSVDVQSVSHSTERVRLTDDGSANVTITFASTRSAAYWGFLETTQPTVHSVTNASSGNGFYNVSVELQEGRTYSLELTKVGVGTGVTDEDAAYLTAVEGDGATVSQGDTTELTLEVRDRFNNPPDNVADLTVEAAVAPGDDGTLRSNSAVPDEDGQVTFVYEATGSAGEQEINVSYVGLGSGFDAETVQNVSMTVDVTSAGSSETTGGTETTLFEDGFEGSPFASTWEHFGAGSSTTTGTAVNSGTSAVEITNADDGGIQMTTAAAVDTSEATSVEVALWAQEGNSGSAPEADEFEDLAVEYYNADGTWDTVARLAADDNVTEREYNPRVELTGDDALHADFRVRVRQLAAGASDPWYVDDVRLTTRGGNSPPTASVTASNSTPSTGETVTFDASGSTDPDGDALSYAWDLDDDGAFDDATGSTASTSFSNTGDQTVTVRVTDGNGGSDTASETVTVEGPFTELTDDFELESGTTPSFSDTNWTNVGQRSDEVTIEDDSTIANSPTHAVNIGDIGDDGGIRSQTTLDTSGLSTVTISTAVREGEPGGDEPNAGDGEDLLLQYENPNGNWVTAGTVTAQGSQRPYSNVGRQSVTLNSGDDPDAFHQDLRVRIVQDGTNGFPDNWFVDDVCVVESSGDCPFGGSG